MTEKLLPGVYVTDDGALHLDIAEMLEANPIRPKIATRSRAPRTRPYGSIGPT